MARVLVVDDDEGIRSFVADALEADGHQVYAVADGEEAVSLLLEQGAFDVVVTDLRMPGLSGLDVVARGRRTSPSTAFVLLTAHGTVDTAVEAMRRGAFDYLEKPIESLAALRRVVRRAAASKQQRVAQPMDDRAAATLPPLGYGAPAMARVEDALTKVARTDATVLLLGESGTGKEIAARTLHAGSARCRGPFIALNCAAIADTLIDSELFGHERGAFTGALARHAGRFERAATGTLFLDEIAELRPELQAKLLRVLEERRFERVGGTEMLRLDVRIVAATHQDLRARVRDGRFREDLYHRLAVFPITLPPLRERREDLAPLANALLAQIAEVHGIGRQTLGPSSVEALQRMEFPGNVRELRNTLERAVILADGEPIGAEHLGDPGLAPSSATGASASGSIADTERRMIYAALDRHGGNRRKAAEELGIGLRTLYDKLKRYEELPS